MRSISRAARRGFMMACAALTLCGVAAQAQQVFKVTAIPDESPTELARKAAPLVKYLEQKLGMKVEFTPVTDYAASVEALANKQVDLAWFGGFTFIQAQHRSGGKIVPLVQRAEDEKFRSVFITTDPAVKSLADLKGRNFSFGSQSSTSGHLMPRSFLLAAGIDPDRDFKRVAYSSAHDATVAAVASGKVDAGAVNISVWEKLVADGKVDPAKVRVFYTTPPFFDYVWCARKALDPALAEAFRKAMLELDAGDPQQKAVLELLQATRYVPADDASYDKLREAATTAGLLR